MVAIGLLALRCMSKSMATLAPSTTSARRLFCPTGRIWFKILVHPFHVLVVMPTNGTPPPLDPNVTKPIRSFSPRFCTRNLSASRSRVIFNPCIDEETGMTTTISSGTCTDAGKHVSCVPPPLPEAVYSVAAVLTDLPAPYDELADDTRFGLFVR